MFYFLPVCSFILCFCVWLWAIFGISDLKKKLLDFFPTSHQDRVQVLHGNIKISVSFNNKHFFPFFLFHCGTPEDIGTWKVLSAKLTGSPCDRFCTDVAFSWLPWLLAFTALAGWEKEGRKIIYSNYIAYLH